MDVSHTTMTKLLVNTYLFNKNLFQILAIGDTSTSPFNLVELRDPSSKQWTRTTDHIYSSNNRWMACLAVSDGTIAIGGTERNTYVYLFKMEKWSAIGNLNSVYSVLTSFFNLLIGSLLSCRDSVQ